MRIAALITSYNRREMTLAALGSLFSQDRLTDWELTVFLVDDASDDGTADAVKSDYPDVRVLLGDGSLFWNGGMRLAFASALEQSYDAYIWLNDDSRLVNDAIERVVTCYRAYDTGAGIPIITGSMRDPNTGRLVYGGWRKKTRGLRLEFVPVEPDPHRCVECDTMNGNFTLIPSRVADALGNLDSSFTHQIGDFDYGLRATAAKLGVVVAPGFFGECSGNSQSGTWRDKTLSRSRRWRHLMSPKGAPLREWPKYVRRHFGWRWPIYAISPYIRVLLF